MSALLVAKNVGKTFTSGVAEPIDVLKGVDFEVESGERVAILGKSGAGKSTFLHILGTLEAPTSGMVTFEGRDVFRLTEAELSSFRNRQLGFVFQFHYLMLEFNALENVMMPALIAGQSPGRASGRAQELLTRVGLGSRLRHKPGQLSGGEQQRVAVARALMMGPKLLLTDEMTGNLDPATGNQVFDLILELQAELGIALVSVTHDEALAAAYPRIYHLIDGRLEPQAPPAGEPSP